MYLSKLEIHGFKSFAQKIKLDFDDGLTCIIGPNGSGKSNIVDAIRWVLGEQRVTSLRSDKMENVIFNGTKTRKPMGMSEVSMTIENNKHILDSEYEEVVIARRLFRSGESHYLINNVPVRLKDVINLFMDTGMGANSYSVIELKMVESILSENKNERRQLFEEAAGVVKYKTRRRSALRKLEQTQQDLERINDIIIEVDKTVSTLGRQVSKARRYLDMTEQLRKNEIDLAVFRYHQLKDQIIPLEQELAEISKEKEQSHHQITLEEAILEDYARQIVKFEQHLQDINKTLYEKDSMIQRLNHDDAIADAKIEEMKKNQARYKAEIDDFSLKIKHLQEEKITYTADLNEIDERCNMLKIQFDKIASEKDNKAESINSGKSEIEALNNTLKQKFNRLNEAKEIQKQKEFRVNYASEQIEKIKGSLQESDEEKIKLQTEIEKNLLLKVEKEADLKATTENLNFFREESQKLQSDLAENQNNHSEISGKLEAVRSQEQFLKNVISNYEGFSEGTRFIMSKKERFPGIYGPLSELIESNDEDAQLLESVLRYSLNYIVVESTEDAKQLFETVKNEKLGQITCIPLDRIVQIERPSIKGNLQGLNFLINKISFNSKFKHLFFSF